MSVETLRPSAVGSVTNIISVSPSTAHWEAVDDAVADDDSSYVYTTNTDEFDTYRIPTHSLVSGVIDSVRVYIRCSKNVASQTGFAKALVRLGTVTYLGATAALPGTLAYNNYSHVWTLSPATSGAWSIPEIDTLQIGIMLTGAGSYGESRCTQVYADINYTPASELVVNGSFGAVV